MLAWIANMGFAAGGGEHPVTWTPKARGVTWTPEERGVTWTPKARPVTWTPESRN